MPLRQNRTRRPALECLERRECLSSYRSAIVHAHLRSLIVFAGTMKGNVVEKIPFPDGRTYTLALVTGRAGTEGDISGSISTLIAADEIHAQADAQIHTSRGNLELGLKEIITPETRGPSHFHGRFTVAHGTGHFASATGAGAIVDGTITSGGSLAFGFNGHIKV
jgi:hypothetical protein